MKKFTLLVLLTSLIHLHAQTGDTAVASAQAATDSGWQNWTFTAIAVVIAAGAVYFVSVDSGRDAN